MSKSYRRLMFEPLEGRQMLATITVTSLADNISVDGEVTLREAIHAAELDVSVDGSAAGSGADTIQFAANLSGAVSVLLVGDVAIDLSAFAITTDITIRGNAAGITIERSGIGPEMRLFRVTASGRLTLESITVSGGLLRGVLGMDPNSGGDARGGAIFNQGTLDVIGSTLVGNAARGGDAVGSGTGGSAMGGAIYNDGGSVLVVNATLSGHLAQSGTGSQTPSSFAGGIYSRNGRLQIFNSTITNNTSTAGRGVFVVADAGSATVEIFSSIIGQAEASPTTFDLILGSEAGGEISVAGADNLVRRQNDFSQITVSDADPLLGPLTNNGGSTPTHALAGSSPAMNQGSNRLSLSTDQRGGSHARVVGGQADIGAFEVQASDGPSLPGDYNENQVVDAADYVIWRKTLGAQVSRFEGADGNGNNSIDPEDFGVWRGNFGRALAGATAAAPAGAEAGSSPQFAGADFGNLRQAAAGDGAGMHRSARDEALTVVRRWSAVEPTHLRDKLLQAIAARSSSEIVFYESRRPETANKVDGESPATESNVSGDPHRLDTIWSPFRPALTSL
ncbi:MAG TPA: choice-of-anchor Q domain-containing protein [Lacipirellulaceae bacterium]